MIASDFSKSRKFGCLVAMCILSWLAGSGQGSAEPAPAPYRTITTPNATGEMRRALTARVATTPREVQVPDAEWLQIKFRGYNLGETGKLTIRDVASGESQTFTQKQLEAWGGVSAIFKSTHLRLSTEVGEEEAGQVFYEIEKVLVGESLEGRRPVTPPGGEERVGSEESQCGDDDDRLAATDARVGRIMPVGCTGWMVRNNTFLTAGHCVGTNMTILEFNVPVSDASGTTTPAAVRDQYAIVQGSIVSRNDGGGATGDDWAVFRVAANPQTGLLPRAAQGAEFARTHSLSPSQVTVTGFGVDTGTANQTQQTHSGSFLNFTVDAADDVSMEYTVDTEGGNSGSPVLAAGGGAVTVGIHTNAGCDPPGEGNVGTSFRNATLWRTINRFTGPWDVLSFSPWAGYAIPNGLWLPADINGDRRTDIVHAVQDSDYVHTWTSQGDGTFTVATFKPWDGYAIPNGLWLPADINGDGRTDIVHAVENSDYVHTWTSKGDGTFTVGTFKPWDGYAIPNGLWLPADINGDGRTDIVHAVQDSDYVHTWISKADGTFTVGTFKPWDGYAIPNGLWLPADINGDGRTDIVHAVQDSDYVHTWISKGDGTFTVGTFKPWDGYAIPNGLWLPADINGDGRTDIVHAVQDSDYVHPWISKGDGTFTVGTFKPWDGYAIPNGLWLPADINGDGRTDIVHAVENSDFVHPWTSNGDGTFTVETFSPWPGYAITNGLWLPLDLNGDRRTDIVHAVENSDYVHPWIAQ